MKFSQIKINAELSAKLLDLVIMRLSLKNDAALSRSLEVAPPVISKIRNGKLSIGATMVIAIHELTGMAIADISAVLAGEVLR